MSIDWKGLFEAHISELQTRFTKILNDLGYDAIVIGAGSLGYYFEDDQSYPFRANHHFNYWCPHSGAEHVIFFKPGEKPRLYAYAPDDFWHEHSTVGDSFWSDSFEIQELASRELIWEAVEKASNFIYHGPDKELARSKGFIVEADQLVARMNWSRSFKTDYEIACLRQATTNAKLAHQAAEAVFLSGGSELDIHMSYLQALRALDRQLPYEGIVCLNEKCAVLHYHEKRDNIRDGLSLLIDSGAQHNFYACDITRTYASEKAPKVFQDLLASTISMQKELCDRVKAGLPMADLHYASHEGLAKLLLDFEIVRDLSPEQVVFEGLSSSFYPHGVGHMLGLLVHDVAGQQIDDKGTPGEKDERFPKLRSTRKLDASNVITVEPGIYFIDSLLKAKRESEQSRYYNWQLIDELSPCGGIRIEDNILVTENGHVNITREILAD